MELLSEVVVAVAATTVLHLRAEFLQVPHPLLVAPVKVASLYLVGPFKMVQFLQSHSLDQ
jgi:hypothetical protein